MSRSRIAAGFAALALSGLGVFGLQSPALANHRCPDPGSNYPPGQCATDGHNAPPTTTGVQVQAGGQVAVNAGGFAAGSTVFIYGTSANGTPILLGSFVADANGNISGFVSAAGLPLGAHNLVITGVSTSGRAVTIVRAFTLIGGKTAPGGGVQLPRTGAEIATVTALGAGLITVGAAAVVSGRRRRTTA